MTERTPPPDPRLPPPIPRRPDPRLDTVRPGIDRPEDRPQTMGRPAPRPSNTQLPQRPPYDPDQPPVGRTSRAAPELRQRGWIWGIALTLFAGLALTGAALAYLAIAPPLDMIRQQVIAQVKTKTGRDLTIAGPTTFTVFPALTLTMRDVTLSAPASMGGDPLVTMAGLDASVRLWPLLTRQISVDQLILRQPVFDLRVDKSGKRSWDFAALETLPLVQYAQAAPAKDPSTGLPDAVRDFVDNASDPDNPSPQVKAKLARLEELTLGDVRIEGGTILYSDARNGTSQQIAALDTRVGLKSLGSPLDATGNLDYQGQTVGFILVLASPKALIQDRPAKLSLSIKGGPIDAKYDGIVTARAGLDLDGDLSAKGASLRALLLWLGHEMPPADGFGPVAMTGKLKATGATYVMNDSSFSLDNATATGMILVDTGSARARINANLKITELDLNRYTLAAGKSVLVPKSPQPIRPAGPSQPAAKSIEDLINGATGPQTGPQVKGYTKRAGWSQDPIPLGALGMFDVDAKLSIGKLLYRDIKVGQSSVTVALKNKVLKTNFDDVALYDGHGRGFISIDSNPPVPVIGANLAVDGISALPLLKDVADFELLAATGKLTVAIAAQGASEAELVSTANGKADFAFTNGALVGYNIPGTIRRLTQGKFSGFDKAASEKTDFSELTATFNIANGVAANQDLQMSGPLLRVTGSGQIQLPNQTLDYTVKPKVVASLQGQGATDALSGLEIPVHISGPWAKPQFAPDASGILKDPSKAIEAAKQLGKQLKDSGQAKELGNALKGLLNKKGSGDTASGDANADTTKPNAKQLLDKLFKQ